MPPLSPAACLLQQEARALLTRLRQVKPFALHETMLPAAALAPAAQTAIEQFLIDGRRELTARLEGYVRWLAGAGRRATPAEQQRRFTVLRLRFLDVLAHFDLFQQAVTQRSERDIGVWLSALDVAAADALAVPGGAADQAVVVYLDRGPGAAIRRARTRLPGGAENPVAMIRIPRERMIGHGVASSLVHEVGHQAAALLDLVESLRIPLAKTLAGAPPEQRPAWRLWGRWISEIVADFWSIGKLGIASTLGLIGVVSLPRPFVFRINLDDPHPFPWIRVRLSCAIGGALYPHRQWRELADLWAALYPLAGLDPVRRRLIQVLEATMPALVSLLVSHRPAALGGRTLGEVMPLSTRGPDALAATLRAWARRPWLLRYATPTLAFAVLGHARAIGRITPEEESRILGDLFTHWALRSTLDAARACAAVRLAAPGPTIQPMSLRSAS